MFLYNYFNPHFRKGSDGDLQSATNIIAISIHTSAREVTVLPLWLSPVNSISIHTSAREVTRLMYCVPDQYWISIHTSAREVTRLFSVFYCLFSISIHTSAREVTITLLQIPFCICRFQSTLPQGKWQSTRSKTYRHSHFNPHFRKGSDRSEWYVPGISGYFNPHFRKGSDALHPILSRQYGNFNPHFRKGSDGDNGDDDPEDGISIHTSAREVTVMR